MPQQTLHPEPSALPSSQAFREEGQTNRYTRNIRLYRDISFEWFLLIKRLERREEPEAQGGEFVEAYVAKRTKQISPSRALALDASATSAGSAFKYPPCRSVESSPFTF